MIFSGMGLPKVRESLRTPRSSAGLSERRIPRAPTSAPSRRSCVELVSESLRSFTRTTRMPRVSTICLFRMSRAIRTSSGCRYEKRISVAGTLRWISFSSYVSTYLRQEIMKGVRPGPLNARLVTRGKTSPVAMPRSETEPIFSPSEA